MSTEQVYLTGWLAKATTNPVFMVNGVLDETVTGKVPTGNPLTITAIMRNQYNTGQDGIIGEIIIIDGESTTAERQKIEGYLAHKWGQQANLPYDHPYRFDGTLFGYPKLPWEPNPATITAWYDASDTNYFAESGGLVSDWYDRSTNSYDLQQLTGGNQLPYNATDANLNSMPTIGNPGEGSKRYMDSLTTFGITRVYATTYWTNTTVSTFRTIFSEPGNSQKAQLKSGGAANTARWEGAGVFVNEDFYRDGSTNAIGGTTDIPLPMAASLWRFDGSGDTGAQTWRMQGGLQAYHYYPYGAVGEMIMTDGTEDAATTQKIEGYLAWKWGLQGNLPSEQPYKNAAP